jgi:SNF2 family DNA or RNA helicase
MACLEFLVNMYYNAMSAVVGDEMGLGKTCKSQKPSILIKS